MEVIPSVMLVYAAVHAQTTPIQVSVASDGGVVFWTAATAVATGLTALVIALGGWAAFRQIRATRQANDLQAAVTILHYADAPEVYSARRVMFADLFAQELTSRLSRAVIGADPTPALAAALATPALAVPVRSGLPTESVGYTELHAYLAALETVACVFIYDYGPDDLIVAYYARIVRHHWPVIAEYAEAVRRYHRAPFFLQHLQAWYSILEDSAMPSNLRSGGVSFFSGRAPMGVLRGLKQRQIDSLQTQTLGYRNIGSLLPSAATSRPTR